MIKIVAITAKCSDLCAVSLLDENNAEIKEHVGYVPHISGLGGGDYLEFMIDNETGRILNWKPIKNLEDIQ